jgi:hypothetical protein
MSETEPKTYCEHISDLKQKLENTYRLAAANQNKAQQNQQNVYNKRAHASSLDIGDRVLVRIVAYDGKHKIADKYEQQPYIVMDKPNIDIPVYVVQQEDRQGPTRILHRNLLLPIGHLPLDKHEENQCTDHESKSDIGTDDSDNEDLLVSISHQPVVKPQTVVLPQPIVQHHPAVLPPPIVQPQTAVQPQLVVQHQQDVQPAEMPALRRSVRTKKKSNWMTTGDYVMSHV